MGASSHCEGQGETVPGKSPVDRKRVRSGRILENTRIHHRAGRAAGPKEETGCKARGHPRGQALRLACDGLAVRTSTWRMLLAWLTMVATCEETETQ